ncbi:glycosyltransferase family 2 protein [Paenibacillus sp. JX-17]|uniref:Glycosyltransferase family 2 protein n=1 Tax=Paenibacillus lacisoli TaxID=3064525 RepID=A0ABT9CBV4_9BACL|nr:glycosyltransferase family 2 protein [Paenibacillus sp. JX-17]MDO7906736.1 glycosyltransferase family 2 protein [Paenibacillus sp. JX-17]
MNGKWPEVTSFFFTVVNNAIVVYIFLLTIPYLVIYLLAARKIYREHLLRPAYDEQLYEELAPPLSVLLHAQAGAVRTAEVIEHLLDINYHRYEIVVVGDMGRDDSLNRLKKEYDLKEIRSRIAYSGSGPASRQVRAVYRSERHRHVIIVDQADTGTASALNAGLAVAQYPYVAAPDLSERAELDRDAFRTLVRPLMETPLGTEVVAVGGSSGFINTGDLGFTGRKETLPRHPLVVMQVIEYLRRSLLGKVGTSQYHLLTAVSGAFALFKRSWVIEAGGYQAEGLDKDLDLILRIYRLTMDKGSLAKVVYVPEPVCWREAPASLSVLRKQRSRGQQGIFAILWKNKSMLWNRRYGLTGFVSVPYFIHTEIIGPILELCGVLLILLGFTTRLVATEISIALTVMMLLYGSLLSAGAVLMGEWRFRRYRHGFDLLRLFGLAMTESIWFRPLMMVWRCEGLLKALLSLSPAGERADTVPVADRKTAE